ncbi:hypothetical protein HanRHA438_Chr00c08g0847671 [Helianthus annuus]|uniref:Uncharacterized protein n=1 Tax=Helianthus annuus TaxID=4232 RepID=A0A251VAR9_HELAN|nr:hypothetical protein HanXRQr2_Chr03g0125561 [Helianthus annuus]KAJ0594087.1 hypothetical protein HanHA300_Chr03g0104561 [Helianthus annuus]KAJ0769172.1 hypothetical protein HanLR1_Chr03g0109781 [Helianthus annuus]KAJ0774922.1 hypothetical protein HanOQP8_Chr03g0117221 [Helianthus annuus]KAJ0936994.1 hypothetical protein HanRHA438_Chr03g0137161 [Helianthus annuus]
MVPSSTPAPPRCHRPSTPPPSVPSSSSFLRRLRRSKQVGPPQRRPSSHAAPSGLHPVTLFIPSPSSSRHHTRSLSQTSLVDGECSASEGKRRWDDWSVLNR